MIQHAETLFPDDPRRVEIDVHTVDLVFLADHPGGRSKASVALPREIADRHETVELARDRASQACQLSGAGNGMFVSILMGW